MYRRAARKDGNHKAIATAFERLGCSFVDLSSSPCGFDGAVGYAGLTMLVEIKNPDADNWTKRSAKTRKPEVLLTENEKSVHDRWTGGKRLVMSMEDVVQTANTLRRWHALICQGGLTPP